jgi:hypothetical protein
MVAAARAGMAAVEEETFGAEPGESGVFVEAFGLGDHLGPGCGGMEVGFDDAGVGCELEDVEAVVVGWGVALDDDWSLESGGSGFDGGDAVEVVLEEGQRRHEDMQATVARFDAEGGAEGAGGEWSWGDVHA